MEFHERQFLRLGKRPMAFVVVAALASLMLTSAGPAQAKRIRGTKGPDKIAGTAKADVIKSLRGNDRIKGRGGQGSTLGRTRRRSLERRRRPAGPCRQGGPGKDVCRIDKTDRVKVKGCETVKVAKAGGPGAGGGGPGGPDLRRPPGGGQARGRRLPGWQETCRRPSAIRSTRSRSPSTLRRMG